MQIEQFKQHFSTGHNYIHFNNSGQALIPDVNRDKAMSWLQRFYQEGAFCSMEAWNETDRTRTKLARFIGAEAGELSFFQTTATALSQVALSIPLQNSEEILIWDQEYPSNFYPWRMAAEKSGAKLIQIDSENWKTPSQKIIDRVSAKTKVIAVSWVQYQTGSVTDLKKISEALRGSGIWLVADVIQGAGVRPLNFRESGFDAICGGSHKWMCSSYGAGFMALKKERMQELAPLEVGAMTYGDPDTLKSFDNKPRTDAKKFEPGSKSAIEIIAMGETLELFMKTGIDNIFSEACRLSEKLSQGLRDLRFDVISEGPIVNFSPTDKSKLSGIIKKLDDGRVSYARRGPGIRLSLHAYNRDAEVERVLQMLS